MSHRSRVRAPRECVQEVCLFFGRSPGRAAQGGTPQRVSSPSETTYARSAEAHDRRPTPHAEARGPTHTPPCGRPATCSPPAARRAATFPEALSRHKRAASAKREILGGGSPDQGRAGHPTGMVGARGPWHRGGSASGSCGFLRIPLCRAMAACRAAGGESVSVRPTEPGIAGSSPPCGILGVFWFSRGAP